MPIEEEIIICAVRYVLGRMTYIVGDVCGYVISKKDSLSDQCKRIIVCDIKEEIELCHRAGKTCGMECDEKELVRLLEALKGE